MDRLILREDFDESSAPTVSGRTLTIRIATYNRVYRVANFGRTVLRERILPGAFRAPLARPSAAGGVLRFRHTGERPGDVDALDNLYGVCTALRERDQAILADYEVFPGTAEDKLLRLVQSGAITGASMTALISGAKRTDDPGGPITDITRVSSIAATSITPTPAYDDAQVLAIREQHHAPHAATRRAERIAAERAYWATMIPLGR
jgi:phage head maturation protease